jgi:hypothetical protein
MLPGSRRCGHVERGRTISAASPGSPADGANLFVADIGLPDADGEKES